MCSTSAVLYRNYIKKKIQFNSVFVERLKLNLDLLCVLCNIMYVKCVLFYLLAYCLNHLNCTFYTFRPGTTDVLELYSKFRFYCYIVHAPFSKTYMD